MSQACRALLAPSEFTARVRASCRQDAKAAITPSTHTAGTAHGRSRNPRNPVDLDVTGALSSPAAESTALLALTCPIQPSVRQVQTARIAVAGWNQAMADYV